MDEDRKSWPLVVGVTAGVLVALGAAVIIYAIKEGAPESKLRDAREIISQCHDRIREIEAGLERLKQPAA